MKITENEKNILIEWANGYNSNYDPFQYPESAFVCDPVEWAVDTIRKNNIETSKKFDDIFDKLWAQNASEWWQNDNETELPEQEYISDCIENIAKYLSDQIGQYFSE